MSNITINGKRYNAKELSDEALRFVADFAKNIRIEQPLPKDTDFTEAEDKEAQTQLRAMLALPSEMVNVMLAAFCAKHLSTMANILRTSSLQTQPKAFSTYVQVLSLLPEATQEPYWRMFLSSPESNGIPNIVGNAFVQGIQWRRPSGPGFICGAMIELLFWCDTDQGDDKKASMDSEVRKGIGRKTRAIKQTEGYQQLDQRQQLQIDRLDGILNVIEHMPGNAYLASTKDGLLGNIEGICGNEECDEDATMRCARCKSVEYCGSRCQSKHWKKDHKMRCFERVTG
ncbi:MYND Zn-finger protein [Ceratobasidium sp. AG-Ba]|nr:MYND Zn-finger protein [Ceratobasidium sp. AG-Ba]QRW09976.1 MYND Zn-finger protein [Ceratobasidium sp. AG-Ba]